MKKSKLLTLSILPAFIFFFVAGAQNISGQKSVVSSPALPDDMNKFFSTHCNPCHFNNGHKMAMVYVNFDDWTKNTPEKQYEKAAKISKALVSDKMPLKSARAKRPEIVPTKEQIEMVKKWAETLKPAK